RNGEPPPVAAPWTPRPAPDSRALFLDALKEQVTDPIRYAREAIELVRAMRSGEPSDASTEGARFAQLLATGIRPLVGLAQMGSAPASSLNRPIGPHRRFETARFDLGEIKTIRAALGGTVNDVVLAVVAGALRAWMMTRGESVSPTRGVRAVVPVSIRDDDDEEPTSLGSRVIASTVNLPVGENSPVMRLHQISYQTKVHKDTGRAVSARSLVGIAGFAPTTLHALAARVATATVRPIDDVVITNVPGPQFPLYAAGAPMLASYPVVPLMPGQGLSVGVTSYDGKVSFGLNADRTAMPDLAVFAQCVTDALDELLDTTKGSHNRASRGRRKPRQKNAPSKKAGS
ncbi:MAG TPA: WS/DGAT domain-containing protein, partial [Kribbella sp.]|uniref:WS/DGAT domain-containing protein n=1 Tax=Kribbella sp. TaxID=1871183 RepID=UPI002D787709